MQPHDAQVLDDLVALALTFRHAVPRTLFPNVARLVECRTGRRFRESHLRMDRPDPDEFAGTALLRHACARDADLARVLTTPPPPPPAPADADAVVDDFVLFVLVGPPNEAAFAHLCATYPGLSGVVAALPVWQPAAEIAEDDPRPFLAFLEPEEEVHAVLAAEMPAEYAWHVLGEPRVTVLDVLTFERRALAHAALPAAAQAVVASIAREADVVVYAPGQAAAAAEADAIERAVRRLPPMDVREASYPVFLPADCAPTALPAAYPNVLVLGSYAWCARPWCAQSTRPPPGTLRAWTLRAWTRPAVYSVLQASPGRAPLLDEDEDKDKDKGEAATALVSDLYPMTLDNAHCVPDTSLLWCSYVVDAS